MYRWPNLTWASALPPSAAFLYQSNACSIFWSSALPSKRISANLYWAVALPPSASSRVLPASEVHPEKTSAVQRGTHSIRAYLTAAPAKGRTCSNHVGGAASTSWSRPAHVTMELRQKTPVTAWMRHYAQNAFTMIQTPRH